ncbi:2-oxoacid:ferredoxin oxidoreductase subunit beta [Bacillus horti]|uniref:2-oxoglutarate ferredoxin oxidoreductase subunit beta n=1 Tax=Caldalkalibacillus horti TaxID=77523 RepID=A0ABT9VU29_9BACI|nr:2-oxoacid:ferredoxin oxidoreductase subunit beta [Bacillus horti]MDQ0164487.1 2-oxoglutarate ferredoxin oxidoreductase subunit beta [Bacillus horti]
MSTLKDFRNDVKPNWCPGCGHFSIQAAIQRAAANLDITPEHLAVVSGIGCSGRISGYINSYGFHGVHGRALPIAQGVKLANPELTVIASGGDGDGYAIGMGHTIHAMRRNINMTYIVMDNQIYGLTKGQTSPRSKKGFTTKSTPSGAMEKQVHPMQLALSSGVGFLAQGFSGDLKGIVSMIEQGMQHNGFSLINIFSPCVTYNKINSYDFFKENIVKLEDEEGYDSSNLGMAMQKVIETNGMLTGVIYQDQEPSFTDQIPNFDQNPIVHQDLHLTSAALTELVEEFC